MIEPFRKGERLLEDIRGFRPSDGIALWWLGQSGYLVKSSRGCLLLDPYLSDSLTRKYADTDKAHVRMTELAIRPEQLDMVALVTSSHNHTDHLDAETLRPLREANPRLRMIIPEANRDFVADRLGCDRRWPVGLTDGKSVEVDGYVVHGIAAAHDEVERDENGDPRFMGYVVQTDGLTVYHSGDTLWHDRLVAQLSEFEIDVALLPINGRLPSRRVAGNLWGQEAACLAHDIDARLAVPCHYDMFTFNTETTDAFEKKCRAIWQPYKILRCGERLEVAR